MATTTKKREQWEVRWNKAYRRWDINRNRKYYDHWYEKDVAVAQAAQACRTVLRDTAIESELTIKRKDGTIQDKRTYGRDPRRTKG